MVKITYIGSQKTTKTQGLSFVNGEPAEISDERIIQKLRGNPFFIFAAPAKKQAKTIKEKKSSDAS